MKLTVFQKKIIKILFFLSLISPVGLLLPDIFKAGDAWGEWDNEQIKEFIGYIPNGMEKLSNLWNAPIPDYSFNGLDGRFEISVAYILSAFGGIFICGFLNWFFIKSLKNAKND